MSVLPTGTVTFLFTDVEDSTKIAQRLGPGFVHVVEDHNEILRSSIASAGGLTVSTEGDSFFAVFLSAADSLRAALESQRRLRDHDWPAGGRVSVRMGVHTGEGRLGGDNYVGIDVIRAARISGAAHGGQVLVSDATRTDLGTPGAGLIDFRDLGHHRLKGLEEAEHLFQLLVPDLPSEFPPLRAEGPPTNLPAGESLFVGRVKEVEEVDSLLEQHRLVTLTGVGGCGKTRLAIEVAGRAIRRFSGGVYLVRLETKDDPDQVAPAIVGAIGASQMDDPFEAIVEQVGSSALLLVIDNFEQITSASPLLAEIVEACSGVQLLVTSRQRLRLRIEEVYAVPPLELPGAAGLEAVRTSDSASLFVSRASAFDPAFALSEENAAVIADIVNQLDGLPLAIELAAAQVRLFGLAALRSELARSVSILPGGFTDAPARHQSLERAIDWSYELLDSAGQAVLRRASVFAGGFSLDSAEAVCDGAPVVSVVETLAQLLDSNLVTSTTAAGSARFRMLETIRSYGFARLTDAGEADTIFLSHCEHFTSMANRTADLIHGPEHHSAMERLGYERANLFAALDWSADNDADLGLSSLLVLASNAAVIGALAEGRQLAERLLAAGGSSGPRLTGLLGAGAITYWLNDYGAAEAYYEEAIALAGELGDTAQLAEALFGRAFSFAWLGSLDRAETSADRAIVLFEESGNERGVRGIMTLRAFVRWMRGDLRDAAARFTEILNLCRRSGDLGGDLFYSLAVSGILIRAGQHEEAASVELHALDRFAEVQDEGGMVHALDWLATSATALDPAEGLVMAGAVHALRGRRGGFIDLSKLGIAEPRTIAAETLSPEAVEAHWLAGRPMDLDETVALAQQWGAAQDIVPAPLDVDSIAALV